MSDQALRIVIGAVLLLHGLGHGGALGALLWIAARPGAKTGKWTAARSWIVPRLDPRTAMAIASVFWVLSLVGFVAAALAFWGVLLPVELWEPLAVVSAIVSLTGIVTFLGNWPAFNTIAAIAVNVAVLACVLALGWPGAAITGA